MTRQVVRKGCSSCVYTDDPDSLSCSWEDGPSKIEYLYSWNALGQLAGAERIDDDSDAITMAYYYNASGARVIRQKADVSGLDLTNIYQDLYIAGGYERRQVKLFEQNLAHQERAVDTGSSEDLAYENVEGSRLVKYASGARIQWKVEEGQLGIDTTEQPQVFLSFDNHLGSTSAVIDYDDGTLVEWNTHYAYGAEESRWKNDDEKYDNAEEPYGFTGKEEDDEVGLHYFGARYYSSYLGRWLSPDPPVVHGGGMANQYCYANMSPYIYVDPDGNDYGASLAFGVTLIVAAVVGTATATTVATVQALRQENFNFLDVFNIIKAGVEGGTIGTAGAVNPWLGAGVAQSISAVNAATSGNKAALGTKQFWARSAIEFSANVAMSYAGKGMGISLGKAGGAFSSRAFGAAVSLSMTAGNQAAKTAFLAKTGLGGSENYEDMLIDGSIGFIVSFAGSTVGSELVGVGEGGDVRNENQSGGSSTGSEPPTVENTEPLTRGQWKVVRKARKEALARLKTAIRRIDRALDPDNAGTEETLATEEIMKTWFGKKADQETLKTLRENLVKSRSKLRSLGRRSFRFTDEDGVEAQINTADQDHIYLGERFFGDIYNGEGLRAMAFVHEATHFKGNSLAQ